MNHALIGQVAGVIAMVQVIPYIISILRGHTKPERMTYFIWFIVNSITVSSYIALGARTTIWTVLMFTTADFFVFLLSIKRGLGGFNNFDLFCLAAALMGAFLWVTTKDASIALYCGVSVGCIGYLPTIKKVYFLPGTENTFAWAATAFASMLNLFALNGFSLHLALPPIMGALSNTLVAAMLLFPYVRLKPIRATAPIT